MIQRLVRCLLSGFIAVTLFVQIGKSFRHVEATEIPDGVNVIVFRAKIRCPTCTAVEHHVRKTLELHFLDEIATGKIRLTVLDYESPENRVLADRFGVGTVTVVLLNQQAGREIAAKNLVTECWKLFGDEAAFCDMLKTNLDAVIRGKVAETTEQPEEIILDPDENLFDDEKP